MRSRHRAAAGAALAALPWLAFAQTPARIDVSARPTAVTVYADQATVTRGGTVQVPAGDSILILSNVPAGLLPDSVNARGRTPGRVSIGAVELRQANFDPAPQSRRRGELEVQLRALDDQLGALDVRLAALNAQQTLIGRFGETYLDVLRRPPPANQPPDATALRQALDPAAWRTVWETLRESTEQTGAAVLRLRQERRGIEERRAAIQAEVASLGARPARGAYEIAVSVSAEAATSLDLAVTYQVRGAAWRPVYEARLDSATARVTLRQEAIVTQATGEDWENVAITLSTARPAAGAEPPTLQPWRITLTQPPMARPIVAPRDAPASPAAEREDAREVLARRAAGATDREAEAVVATVAAAGLAIEYAIPGVASVRADGTQRRVRIAEHAAEAALSARAVPRLDRRAFLRAAFATPGTAPMLPGQAALFLDGVLVGRTNLPLLRPGEQTGMSFGADDRIRVAYDLAGPRRATGGGLFNRVATIEHEAVIVVQSFHTRPIELTVLDHAPVSQEEGLTVEVTAEPAPTARDVDDRPGIFAWTLTLPPREERRIRFGYTVSAPRDRPVYGLPR